MFNLLISYQEFDIESGDQVGQGVVTNKYNGGLRELLDDVIDLGDLEINVQKSRTSSSIITEINARTYEPEIDNSDNSVRYYFIEITGRNRALKLLPKLIKAVA